jgi:hypothetical protein
MKKNNGVMKHWSNGGMGFDKHERMTISERLPNIPLIHHSSIPR